MTRLRQKFLTHRQRVIATCLALLWFPVLVIWPVWTYHEGTTRNMSVEVISEPYVESEVLTYRWSGDVYRSCEVTLRRSVVDSAGQVHTLVDSPNLPPLPMDRLGHQSYLIDVQIGPNIPEGPAEYRVYEVPRCSWLQRLRPVSVQYPPVKFTVHR